MRCLSRIVLVLSCGASVLLPASARADAESARRAERLFKEGADALEHGRYDEACTKLKESSVLVPALGTQYNLGVCYELTHRPASAKQAFLRTAELATKAGKEGLAKDAHARAKKVDVLVPRLLLRLPEGATSARVRLDDTELEAKALAAPIELDPGPHQIHATAPGRTAFEAKVELAESRTTEIAVALLLPNEVKIAPPPSPPTPPPPEQPSSNFQKPIAIGVVGLGVVALGVSGFFGLQAKNKLEDSGCRDGQFCPNAAAAERLTDAKNQADLATILAIGGGVALVAGTVLYFTAPSSSPTKSAVRVVPSLSDRQGSVFLSGTF